MSNQTVIQHTGYIREINGNDIKVSIISQSACSSCHAKSACGVSDASEKIIDIKRNPDGYTIGEQVTVYMKQSMGLKAVFMGYVLPFIVLFIVLIISINTIKNEGISALLALGSLIPYYSLLYYLRDKVKQSFSFQIQKII